MKDKIFKFYKVYRKPATRIVSLENCSQKQSQLLMKSQYL